MAAVSVANAKTRGRATHHVDGNLSLQGQSVVEVVMVLLGPDVILGCRRHELRRDADTVATRLRLVSSR